MKITKLELKNFRRFINLSALKTVPQLVLLIGANVARKSSMFDAFEVLELVQTNWFKAKIGGVLNK